MKIIIVITTFLCACIPIREQDYRLTTDNAVSSTAFNIGTENQNEALTILIGILQSDGFDCNHSDLPGYIVNCEIKGSKVIIKYFNKGLYLHFMVLGFQKDLDKMKKEILPKLEDKSGYKLIEYNQLKEVSAKN